MIVKYYSKEFSGLYTLQEKSDNVFNAADSEFYLKICI